MGRLTTQAMIENFDANEKSLKLHLTANFFPPVHIDFIQPAKKAIIMVREDKGNDSITMPNGVTKTAWEIVEGLRLEEFLNDWED